MGQEERKNKAKLEKTQIQVAASNTEYENAVKVLEETTGRWNRDWKAACDVRYDTGRNTFYDADTPNRNSKISKRNGLIS